MGRRREYELLFGEGPLGLTLQPHYRADSDFPNVVVMKCIPNHQAEAFGAISEGDYVIAVQDRTVETFEEYSRLIQFLKESSRPLKLRFSSKYTTTPAERVREGLQARMDALESALQRPEIQLDEVREFARAGLPDKYRAVVWKLLLGNLPTDRSKWDEYEAKQRALYQTYVQDMFAPRVSKEPLAGGHSQAKDSRPARMEGQAWYEHCDNSPSSERKALPADSTPPTQHTAEDQEEDEIDQEYEEVEDVLDEDVWKDVQRTHPGYHFFTQPTYVRMHRILYIYGKLNSGVSYVQGMNEILAPIMYVLGAYPGSDEATYEADSFFCFAALMSEVRDLFIRSLDGEKSGLHGQIEALELMVTRHDPQVAMHMKQIDLHTQFFAVRWLTTMLTREYELPDALRLWDSMLSSQKRFHFILCCCTAMITVRHQLFIQSDFPTSLKALQATCTVPVETVLKEAERIRRLEMNKRRSWVPGGGNNSGLEKVEGIAKDLFRFAARAAKTVVDEAKLVVDELKQPPPSSSLSTMKSPSPKQKPSTTAPWPVSSPPVHRREGDDEGNEEETEGDDSIRTETSPWTEPAPIDFADAGAMAALLGRKRIGDDSKDPLSNNDKENSTSTTVTSGSKQSPSSFGDEDDPLGVDS